MVITQIEQAIVTRLKQGLGRMVREVSSYGGEMDGEPAEVIRQLPGVWVTFGGIQKTERLSTARNKFVTYGRFVVIVGDRSVRSEEASRTGGVGKDEIGTYRMVAAVRRLLSGQDFDDAGLKIDALLPGKVRTLFNTQYERSALSVFACEFDTKWVESALENGRFPLENAPVGHEDNLFTPYGGKTTEDDPAWLSTNLSYYLEPGDDRADAEDIIPHASKNS
ncbi:DUF1834 family protein [Salmonella enterica subsp. enterica serovar Give]|uniref:DUF1834 family protein n=1 Tax=Enterobacteriaceae TaxID=543 RepID=UPI00126EEC10|nr:DUF1834 family protein [Citrobacter portucalensis]EBZ1172219.1 DUF1834 family protein [Salmonella enterica subsp. enterica serovar Give]HAY5591931.1 DUF1834 family protein [Escherichia coli]HEP1897653.1 DUF1834 family protein [Kluyvera cryocrescens]ECE9298451.1 DUF1834 family protein [Salmonella enterica subsp. enterica serovar Give]MCX9056596.1 DUF1834 family protein [Citrobacter portucalensis]